MQLKPITAIIVLSLVLASLLVAGCTVKPTVEVGNQHQTTNQAGYVSTAYPSSGRSELIQGVTTAHREARFDFESLTVTWINNTAAKTTGILKSGEGARYSIMTENTTYIHFPTVEAASAYFNSLRPQYPEKRDYIAQGTDDYYRATGKLPTVEKELQTKWTDEQFSTYLTQQDALITQRSFTFEYPNEPTNQA